MTFPTALWHLLIEDTIDRRCNDAKQALAHQAYSKMPVADIQTFCMANGAPTENNLPWKKKKGNKHLRNPSSPDEANQAPTHQAAEHRGLVLLHASTPWLSV